MKRQRSITLKLFASLGILSATALTGSFYSVLNARRLRNTSIQEMADGAKLLDESRQIGSHFSNMRLAMRGISLFCAMAPERAKKERSNFEASAAKIRNVVQEMEGTTLSSEERAAINDIRSDIEQWLARFGEFADQSFSGHADTAAQSALKTMTPIMDSLQKRTADLGNISRSRQDKASEATLASMRRSELLNWLGTLIVLFVAASAFAVVVGLARILRGIAAEVSAGAREVAGAASHISSASQSLAQGSSEQAASLEETSAATKEISSMARKNAENSKAAMDITVQSASRIEETNRLLEQMVGASAEIDASSNKISKIIKVIDEIAFQTNILALNAAVEAARAGEAGMGFAVVADEVRNLAQRSSQAAKDTAALIEESIEKSSEGSTRVEQVAQALRAITEDAGRMKLLVEEVHVGSNEQARGIEQVAQAISQMDQVTQKTAADAEESAASSAQLKGQSDSLNSIAGRLTSLVSGATEV